MSTSNRITPLGIIDFDDDNDNVIDTSPSMRSENVDSESNEEEKKEANPLEAWLPITESRNGNVWSCVFHLVCTGIDMQIFMLPVSFAIFGWALGITYLFLAFSWQLYTRWLLIQLHETASGTRYSRFMQLAIAAFGPKLAKWLCLSPVLYLSSAQCTMMVITGSLNMRLLYQVMCSDTSHCSKPLSLTEWFLVFACFAAILAQHPNLNSLKWVSFFGTITTLLFCSLPWIMSLAMGRVQDISYDPTNNQMSSTNNFTTLVSFASAMEFTALTFRGHNLILEIQGTLPSSIKHPSHRTMWKSMKIAYVLIALCMFPIAIVGHWTYGDRLTRKGLLNTIMEFHPDKASKTIIGLTLIFLIIKQVCSYSVYAMVSIDNFELKYTMAKNKPCDYWLRRVIRGVVVAVNLFFAIALPFLPSLTYVISGLMMAFAFSYPCFIWIAIKKPKVGELMFWLNWGLGFLGVLLALVSCVAGISNLSRDGLTANFFQP